MTPRSWLAVVAVGFGAVQALLISGVALGWDESIYASQNDPRRPALAFTAPRARGMPWLAAPLQAVTGSTPALRIYLAVLAAFGLYAAYAVWLRLRDDGSVPLAALGLSSLWITVFYGPSLMPNVAIALVSVFATGTLLCDAQRVGTRWLPWAGGAAVAAATLIRPGDVVPLLGALGAAVLIHPRWRRRTVSLLMPLAVGAAVGAVPWLVEAQLRYDNIPARIRRALSTQSTGERFVPDYQLRALDGPLLCRPCNRETQPIPPMGVLLWLAGAVLVGLAVWLAVRQVRQHRSRMVTLLPAWVGGLTALPYLFLVGYAAPRFLLPSYALLAIPAAQALHHLCVRREGSVRRPAAALVAVLMAGHLAVQYRVLDGMVETQQASRDRWAQVARVLGEQGIDPPCLLVGTESAPVAYVARCDAVHLRRVAGDEPFDRADLEEATTRQSVALVLRSGQGRPTYARSWQPLPASAGLPRGWRVFVAPR
jgi:hypothetical protein